MTIKYIFVRSRAIQNIKNIYKCMRDTGTEYSYVFIYIGQPVYESKKTDRIGNAT